MKRSVSQYDFEQAFRDYGRSDHFTYEGLKALFEWFEQLDEDCGTETELDVIAVCCEFSEYENLAEFQNDYGSDKYPDIESIQYYTSVIEVGPYYPSRDESDTPFIIQQF